MTKEHVAVRRTSLLFGPLVLAISAFLFGTLVGKQQKETDIQRVLTKHRELIVIHVAAARPVSTSADKDDFVGVLQQTVVTRPYIFSTVQPCQ